MESAQRETKSEAHIWRVRKPIRDLLPEAERQKGITSENLLYLLERRLDNVVFRMGFANSRTDARQLVRHRHILVNGELLISLLSPQDLTTKLRSMRKAEK